MKIILAFSLIISIINCSFKTNNNGGKNLLKTNSLHLSREYHNNLRKLENTTVVTTQITPTIPSELTSQLSSGLPSQLPSNLTSTSVIPSELTSQLSSGLPSQLPSDLTSIPTTNGTIHPEQYILYGFKNNSENKNNSLIEFYAYVKIININKDIPPNNTFSLNVTLNKNKRQLRFLEEVEIECKNYEEKKNDKIYKYTCNKDYNGIVEFVDIDSNGISSFKKSPYAKFTQNLNNVALDLLEKNQIIMNNCSIEKNDYEIKIQGNAEREIPNQSNPSLYVVTENNELKKISCKYKRLNNDINTYTYQLICNPENSLKAKLNNTYGRINDDNYIMLNFENNNDEVNCIKSGGYFPIKSSGGLSAGGIVAIILPCVAALIAVAALAFLLGRKTVTPPPMQNVGNNTIGISSSTNAVQ